MTHREIFNHETIVGSPVRHYLQMVLMMMVVWLMVSGRLEAKYLIMGLGTALIAAWVVMPIMYIKGKHSDRYYFVFGVNWLQYAFYWLWLINEVRAASLDVASAVMRPEMAIDPKFFGFKAHYDNPMAHATLANSITLTPGTVTLHVSEDGVYSIHALTPGATEGLLDGGMQEKVGKLFGEPTHIDIMMETPAMKEVQG